MATIYQKVGARIRKIRKQQKITQEQLAEMAKVEPRTIIAIEQGKSNPTLKTVHKLAKALKVHSSKLLPF